MASSLKFGLLMVVAVILLSSNAEAGSSYRTRSAKPLNLKRLNIVVPDTCSLPSRTAARMALRLVRRPAVNEEATVTPGECVVIQNTTPVPATGGRSARSLEYLHELLGHFHDQEEDSIAEREDADDDFDANDFADEDSRDDEVNFEDDDDEEEDDSDRGENLEENDSSRRRKRKRVSFWRRIRNVVRRIRAYIARRRRARGCQSGIRTTTTSVPKVTFPKSCLSRLCTYSEKFSEICLPMTITKRTPCFSCPPPVSTGMTMGPTAASVSDIIQPPTTTQRPNIEETTTPAAEVAVPVVQGQGEVGKAHEENSDSKDDSLLQQLIHEIEGHNSDRRTASSSHRESNKHHVLTKMLQDSERDHISSKRLESNKHHSSWHDEDEDQYNDNDDDIFDDEADIDDFADDDDDEEDDGNDQEMTSRLMTMLRNADSAEGKHRQQSQRGEESLKALNRILEGHEKRQPRVRGASSPKNTEADFEYHA